MLTLVVLLLAQPQVEGLKPGETAREIAPALVAPDPAFWHGRIVDALTGRPVGGAAIETWTEETDRQFGGFHRVGEATSGIDGRFAIRVSPHAQKVRIEAPGYATLSAVPGDLMQVIELFPAPADPVRLRFVDADDRPIAGVRITTTYSCAHDVPAFDVRSDATGEVRLPAYGRQEDIQDLRVRAAGYRAIKYLNPRGALASPQPWVVRLARAPGASATVLDATGAPLCDTPVVVRDGEGEHMIRTDTEGRFVVPSLYLHDDLLVEHLKEPDQPAFLLGKAADATIRLGALEWPADQPVGTVKVVPRPAAGDDELLPHVRALHDGGWTEGFELGKPFRFPAGRVRLALGGAFTGYGEAAATVEVVAGQQTEVELAITREPSVTVRLPEGTHEAWIEAGSDSVHGIETNTPISVPAGRPLVFFARTASAHHLVRRASADDKTIVDLSGDATRVHRIEHTERGQMTIVVAGEGAAAQGKLDVLSPHGDFRIEDLESPGRYHIEGPTGVRFFVRWRGDGLATTGFGAVLTAGDAPERTLTPVRLSSLAIESTLPYTLIGMDDLDLEALHPGPLRVVLAFAGGKRLGLSLDLAPGEARRLRVR